MSPSVVFVIEDLVVDSLLLTFESVTVEVWGDICVECAVDLLNLVVDAAIVVKLVESILLVVDESCVVNVAGVVAVDDVVVRHEVVVVRLRIPQRVVQHRRPQRLERLLALLRPAGPLLRVPGPYLVLQFGQFVGYLLRKLVKFGR